MPQLSLYLNDTEMQDLREAATKNNSSISGYARRVLHEQKCTNSWSSSFLSTFGAINDETFKVPDDLPWSLDAKRSEF